jgi:arabinofuranan 3-O-arabinosyltransferase
LDGKTLAPVTLDGWQQGYVVPAGSGGVITMAFSPAKAYHAWIILSAVGVLLLVALTVARRRRRRVHDQMDRALSTSAPALPTTERADQPADATSSVESGGRPSMAWLPWAGLIALCGLVAIVGGWVALAVPVVALLAYRWPGWYGAIALAAMIGTGLLTVLPADTAPTSSGAFGWPAQALALIALTVALIPAWPAKPARSGRP